MASSRNVLTSLRGEAAPLVGWLDSSRTWQGGDSSVLNPVTQFRHLERASPLASAIVPVPLPEDQLRQQEGQGLCACAFVCAPCAARPLQQRPCTGLRALSSWPCWVGISGGGLPWLGWVDSRGRVGRRRRLCVLLHEMRTPLLQFSETLFSSSPLRHSIQLTRISLSSGGVSLHVSGTSPSSHAGAVSASA